MILVYIDVMEASPLIHSLWTQQWHRITFQSELCFDADMTSIRSRDDLDEDISLAPLQQLTVSGMLLLLHLSPVASSVARLMCQRMPGSNSENRARRLCCSWITAAQDPR